jgi:hypothetical protein
VIRRFVAFTAVLGILAGTLVAGTALSAQATDAAPGDAYQVDKTAVDSNTQILAAINDKAGNDWTGLMKQIPLELQNANREGWQNCSSLEDKSCDFRKDTSGVYQGQVILQTCGQTTSPYCVESLELAAPGGDYQPAAFVREAKQPVWKPDTSVNWPGGSGQSLFEAQNAPTAGGLKTYAVQVTLKASWDNSTGKFNLHDIFAAVLPYRGVEDASIDGRAGWGTAPGQVCSWIEPGYCGVAQDWVAGTKARLKFKMPSDITGWFKGRIQKPDVQINPVDSATNEVSVAAEPALVAQLAVAKPTSEKNFLLDSGWDLGHWGAAGFE